MKVKLYGGGDEFHGRTFENISGNAVLLPVLYRHGIRAWCRDDFCPEQGKHKIEKFVYTKVYEISPDKDGEYFLAYYAGER